MLSCEMCLPKIACLLMKLSVYSAPTLRHIYVCCKSIRMSLKDNDDDDDDMYIV